MIVDNDHTYIKITESNEIKKTEPAVPQILGKQKLLEMGKEIIEPVNAVVMELPLTEKQRAEFELFKQLINS